MLTGTGRPWAWREEPTFRPGFAASGTWARGAVAAPSPSPACGFAEALQEDTQLAIFQV